MAVANRTKKSTRMSRRRRDLRGSRLSWMLVSVRQRMFLRRCDRQEEYLETSTSRDIAFGQPFERSNLFGFPTRVAFQFFTHNARHTRRSFHTGACIQKQ